MQHAPGIRGLDEFAAGSFTDAAGPGPGPGPWHELPYRLLLPEPGAPAGRYPLLLVLHGAGERGTENVAQLSNGIAQVLLERRRQFPCIAVVPQCPPGRRWVEVDWGDQSHVLPQVPSAPMHAVVALLDALGHHVPGGAGIAVDPRRLYLLGLSMGGYGVWDAVCRQPQRFAAAVPICGGAPEEDARAPVLCGIPVWAFHGARDPVVPVERSRRIIAALRRHCDPATVRYTEYADLEHNAWTAALGEPDLWPWLFAQHTKNPAAHAN
jgi:predicted peptidase